MLKSNEGIVEGLKNELAEVKEQMKFKKEELETLQEELRKKNNDIQDLVNKELWERNKEVEKLEKKLSVLNQNHKDEIESLRYQLQTGNQLLQLQSQSISNLQHTPASAATQKEQVPNIVNLTQINNIQDTKIDPQSQTNLNDEKTTVKFLYQEMGKIRYEAQALRQERMVLNDKLQGLQSLYKDCTGATDTEATDIRQQIDCLKKQVEETKEESIQKDKQHDQVVSDFQEQIEMLRTELNNAKKKITQQISEVSVRKYKEALKSNKKEIVLLRKRLSDSHNTCDQLRNHLEELADFLERIIEMDKSGLISLSQFSIQELSCLHEKLNESRALSQTLSHSLLIGLESFIDNNCGPDENNLSSSVSSVSSFSLQKDDSLTEVHDNQLASSQEGLPSLVQDQVPLKFTTNESICLDMTTPDAEYQVLAAKLTSEIDLKGKEIDGIAEKFTNLSQELQSRVSEIQKQSDEISNLKSEVTHLKEEVRLKDRQLGNSSTNVSTSSIDQSNLENSSSIILHLKAEIQSLKEKLKRKDLEIQNNIQESSNKSNTQDENHYRSSPTGNLSISSCSDNLPPPPGHPLSLSENRSKDQVEQEFEMSQQQSDNGSAVKSAYSTDIAIKANSNNPEYFQKLSIPLETNEGKPEIGECVSAGGALERPVWTLPSPSESEAWSEPDRNVSLARIGLDTCNLAVSLDRSLSRSRQTRISAALSSESEAEIVADETSLANGSQVSGSNKVSKRRSDAAEFRRICAKLRNVEQLNETLKAELNIYQTLSQQIPQSSKKERQLKNTNPKTRDKSVETYKEETADVAVSVAEDAYIIPILPTPLLDEIRALRVKLEEAIANNDHLRDQLEAAIAIHPNEDPHIHQLALTLQATTEQLQFAQEKLTAAYKSEQTVSIQLADLKQKLIERVQKHEELCAQFEIIKVENIELKKELKDANRILKDKDTLLHERTERLAVAEEYKMECEAKLLDQDKAITNLCDNLTRLQKQAQSDKLEEQNKYLQESLQATEAKLLQVTKERLSLVGERTKLHAQLASATTQAHLMKGDATDSDYKSEEEHSTLVRQLEKSQASITSLELEKQKLLNEKHSYEKEREILKEEITALRGQNEHMLVRETHMAQDQARDIRDAATVRTKLSQIHHQYISLQNVHSTLQCEARRLETEVSALKLENKELNNMLSRTKDSDARLQQLSVQLESERRLTNNLQLQLDSLKSIQHSSSPTTDSKYLFFQINLIVILIINIFIFFILYLFMQSFSALQEFSDITSPSSATSFEYIVPSNTALLHRPSSLSSLGSTRERRRRSSSSRRRHSERRNNDNKENLSVTSPIVSTAQLSIHDSRRTLSVGSSSLPPVGSLDQEGALSGESPDLGIGSDCHLSSLERSARNNSGSITQHRPTELCSDPSKLFAFFMFS